MLSLSATQLLVLKLRRTDDQTSLVTT